MVQKKFFVKNFENFRGLDLSKSYLGRESDYAFECSNLELDAQNSVQEISEVKIVATTLKEARYTAGGKYCCETGPRFGMKRYAYQDRTTGETKDELVGIGNGLWKLAKATLTITGPAGSKVRLSDTLSYYEVNGVSVHSKIWTGGGSTYTAGSRLADLVADITTNLGGSGWSASLTPRAVVNGAQAGKAKCSSVTVAAGHTVSLTGRTTPLRLPLSCYYPGGTTPIVMWMDIIVTGATTLTVQAFNTTSRLEGLANNTTFDCTTGHEFGVGNFPIHALPYVPLTSCSSGLTIEFYYWEQVYCANYDGSLLLASNHSWDDEKSRLWYPQMQNFVAENMANCIFVGSPIALGIDSANNNAEVGLVKYDGQSSYLAGLPQPPLPTAYSVTAIGAGGLDPGTYKYLLQYKHTDPRGNVIYSNPTLFLGEIVLTATNPAGQNRLDLTHYTGTPSLSNALTLKYGTATINGNQTLLTGSASRSITINNPHTLRVGEYACYIDRSGSGLKSRLITSVSATSVTLEFLTTDATETVNNTDGLSTGHIVQIWRTKKNGQTYYLELEKPYYDTLTTTHQSVYPDSSLTIEWDGPPTGSRRRDMPPPGPLVTVHQGKIIVGGYAKTPNTLNWSGTDSCEQFSLSTNSTNLASTAQGPITAIASAGSDVLLAWKERSLLTVVGDFYSGAVYTAQALDGDVGCPSATGWCRVRDALVWMSPIGLRSWKDGQVSDMGDRIRARLPTTIPNQTRSTTWDSQGLLARRTVAYNDPYNQRAIFFVPYEQTSLLLINEWKPVDSSKFFVWDYKNDFISEWTNDTGQSVPFNAAGGIDYYNNEVFFLGRVKVDYQDYLQSYLWAPRRDGGGAVYGTASLSVQWEFLGEPSFPKDFLSIKVWKVNDSTNSGYSTKVRTYSDFSTSTYDQAQIDWSTGQTWSDVPLTKFNRSAAAFNFRPSIIGEPLRLTGYELIIATPFRKERTDFEP